MKHITIILPSNNSNLSTVSCIAGAFDILNSANAFARRTGLPYQFEIQLAGTSTTEEVNNGLLIIKPHCHISEIQKTNLIIIPSSVPFYQKDGVGDQVLLDQIVRLYNKGAQIATMCSGAFMLASTGLLDGKTCSTHWAHADALKKQFPDVRLKTDQLITDENGICTNGGAYSFLNLMIYLVEKYYDRPTAIYCSKIFQIEMDRNSQSGFAIFTGQKNHGDKLIEDAQTFIESAIADKISIEELSSRFAVGRRNFDRRFIKATGNTPAEYAQRVRIEAAKKSLESSRKNVNEIMYKVGYTDVKAFREMFRKIAGMSPLEYRSRYNKAAISD